MNNHLSPYLDVQRLNFSLDFSRIFWYIIDTKGKEIKSNETCNC